MGHGTLTHGVNLFSIGCKICGTEGSIDDSSHILIETAHIHVNSLVVSGIALFSTRGRNFFPRFLSRVGLRAIPPKNGE